MAARTGARLQSLAAAMVEIPVNPIVPKKPFYPKGVKPVRPRCVKTSFTPDRYEQLQLNGRRPHRSYFRIVSSYWFRGVEDLFHAGALTERIAKAAREPSRPLPNQELTCSQVIAASSS
jgi:hypothetical protein